MGAGAGRDGDELGSTEPADVAADDVERGRGRGRERGRGRADGKRDGVSEERADAAEAREPAPVDEVRGRNLRWARAVERPPVGGTDDEASDEARAGVVDERVASRVEERRAESSGSVSMA